MSSYSNPPAYPEPVLPSVEELTADRSLLVRVTVTLHLFLEITKVNIYLQNITQYIHRDLPEHQWPIGVGASGNVYRGIYRWIDPNTRQMQSLNVGAHK
jgi:hypothetical protein